jgi:sulfite reductase (ferredoxin)
MRKSVRLPTSSSPNLPQTRAYAEIWLNGEKLYPPPEAENEPLYGQHYLPRKFKIGVIVPPRNDVDIYTHDIGYVAHAPNGQVEGYTILVGGGFGMTHGKLKTYPVLAKPLFYVAREHAVAAGVAIVTVQRDYGNREDRSRARMKYLIEERGLAWFRQEVEARLPAPTEPPKPLQLTTVADARLARTGGRQTLLRRLCAARADPGYRGCPLSQRVSGNRAPTGVPDPAHA